MFENHKAYPSCRNRAEKVACVAEAMRRLGDGCTETDLIVALGITKSQLHDVADDARAMAMAASITQKRARVSAGRIAA